MTTLEEWTDDAIDGWDDVYEGNHSKRQAMRNALTNITKDYVEAMIADAFRAGIRTANGGRPAETAEGYASRKIGDLINGPRYVRPHGSGP